MAGARFDPAWARQVLNVLDDQRLDLHRIEHRSQVDEALLADAALDRSLLAELLGHPVPEVLAGLEEARKAMRRVAELGGTSHGIPVLDVREDGLYFSEPAADDSLNTSER